MKGTSLIKPAVVIEAKDVDRRDVHVGKTFGTESRDPKILTSQGDSWGGIKILSGNIKLIDPAREFHEPGMYWWNKKKGGSDRPTGIWNVPIVDA